MQALLTWRVCFSSRESCSIAPCRLVWKQITVNQGHTCLGFVRRANLGQKLCLGNLLVDLLGEVLVGFVRGFSHLGWLVARLMACAADFVD